MKMLFLILTLGFGLQTWADHHMGEGKGTLEERKAKMLKNIDERLANLNKHKTCVTAAATQEALKTCHQQQREFFQNSRHEHMQGKMDRMDARKERMKKKMDKMNQ